MDQRNVDSDVERFKVNEYTCVHAGVTACEQSQWGPSPTRAGLHEYAWGPWQRRWPWPGAVCVCPGCVALGDAISRALGVCVCARARASEDKVHSLKGRAHHPRASPPVTGGHTLHQTVSGSWWQTVALASGMGNSCFLENSWCPCWRPPRACDSAVVLGGCCH